MVLQLSPRWPFEWKLLILNRIIASRRFAEPFQNLSNHFKNARADRSGKSGKRRGLRVSAPGGQAQRSAVHLQTARTPSVWIRKPKQKVPGRCKQRVRCCAEAR